MQSGAHGAGSRSRAGLRGSRGAAVHSGALGCNPAYLSIILFLEQNLLKKLSDCPRFNYFWEQVILYPLLETNIRLKYERIRLGYGGAGSRAHGEQEQGSGVRSSEARGVGSR